MSGTRLRLASLTALARQAHRGWTAAAAGALNLLFPPACTHCQGEIEEPADGILLCQDCRQAFDPGQACYCLRCGALLGRSGGNRAGCELCPENPTPYDAVVTLGQYRGPLRDAMLQMKLPAGEPLARALARLYLLRRGPTLAKYQPDLLLPIPMFWRRRISRGTNSPDLLADEMARSLRIPVLRGALVRSRNTRVQRNLKPHDRFQNVRRAFRLHKGYDFQGLHIALVDDVLTTGATCGEAARVLKRAGSSTVTIVAIARGGGKEVLPLAP